MCQIHIQSVSEVSEPFKELGGNTLSLCKAEDLCMKGQGDCEIITGSAFNLSQ